MGAHLIRQAHAAPARSAAGGDLAALACSARAAGRIAVDTEFMSEGRYLPLLCLVGVAVPAMRDAGLVERAELIDSLDETVDVTPLAEVLADPDVQVVVHAGRQDVALLRRAWRTEVRNLFDTQIAAGFASFGAQTSYGGLLADVLGLRLAKSASFTRWDVRPLTAEQVAYARDDVVPLLSLAGELERRLATSGRLEWAREECRRLEGASDERDPGLVWQRLPKIGQLSPAARAVARELAAWRERTAAGGDRPVGSVLPDAPLIEVAKRRPTTVQALERIRGIQPSTLRRRADAILAAVERGLVAQPLVLENGERLDSSPADSPLIALAEALVRARALEAGLAYELVAARYDLAQIVSAVRRGRPEPQVRTLQGWRRNLVGAELLDLLAGERVLSVGPSGRVTIASRGGGSGDAAS
ncbi:MAG TPA: HRDC domain-containing protein [Actinomycetes bacterium]|nr:HRDC domain-containing protein [Actinomycetes bacterium]